MGKMQFWGSLTGRGNEVERGGSKDSGLKIEAAGWKGRIVVRVFHNEEKGRDEFRVWLRPHWNDDNGDVGTCREIASGILDDKALSDPFIPALIA